MRIHAFQGYRYTSAAGDPDDLAAPPFDQIGPGLRDRLHDRPHQFSHLTRPVAPEGGDAHAHAAELHRRWLDEGLVERDREPSLYPYVTHLADGGQRLGLCTLVGIEPLDAGIIRPHERTVSKTVSERLDLLRRMAVDLEPILLLADDDGWMDELLAEDMAGAEPLAEHTDPRGDRHVVHRLTDPERIGRYRELLEPSPALIADGHHRYRVAQLHAQSSGAGRDEAAGSKLAVLTSLASPRLTIDPIHRALERPIDLAGLEPFIHSGTRWQGAGGADLAAAVAAAPQPAIGVWQKGSDPEIWHLDTAHRPRELPDAAGELAVVLLHHALLPAVGLGGESAVDGTIGYRSDPDELYGQVAGGELAVGIWMPPMDGNEFAAAIADGDVLPPKSTRFMPKLVSGLVWCGHDAELG